LELVVHQLGAGLKRNKLLHGGTRERHPQQHQHNPLLLAASQVGNKVIWEVRELLQAMRPTKRSYVRQDNRAVS
jgi:hypothetical protein